MIVRVITHQKPEDGRHGMNETILLTVEPKDRQFQICILKILNMRSQKIVDANDPNHTLRLSS